LKPALLPHATVGRLLGLVDAIHPLIASIIRALAADTPVDWGRWPELFDHDADDACILRTGEGTR
jgi:hypothetical protein